METNMAEELVIKSDSLPMVCVQRAHFNMGPTSKAWISRPTQMLSMQAGPGNARTTFEFLSFCQATMGRNKDTFWKD